jgi:RecB family exonuclease
MNPPRRAVLGSFAALELALLAAVRETRAASGPLAPIPVLVPSNLLRAHLIGRLAEGGGAVNVRFQLVPDLARALAPGATPLPPFLDDLLVEAVLDTAETAGGPFAAIRGRPGLRAALLDVFRDLLEARISPGDFARAASGAASFPGAADRLAEVARLFAAYRRAVLATGHTETSDVIERAITRAGDAPFLAGARAGFVYGFYDFTAVQLALVEALADRLPVTVFLPWAAGQAFAYARPALAALVKAGFATAAAPSPPEAAERPELRALRHRLFEPPGGEAVAASGAVAIVSCPGERREAREIARRISALARAEPDLDLAFERVAVLPRHLDVYRGALAGAFTEHGVAAGVARPLIELRPGRTLLAILAARRSDLGRREVMDLLEVADLGREIESSEQVVSTWDRLSREAGIAGGRREWEERLEAFARARPGGDGGGDRRRAWAAATAARLRAFVLDLGDHLDTLPLRALPSRHCAAAAELLKRLAGEGDERDRVLDLLRGLGALDAAGRDLPLERFASLCESALAASRMPAAGIRPLVRGVLVADLMSARGVPFDVVVVPGLVERQFPAPPREDPVLLDDERLAVGRLLGRPDALRPKASRIDEERLLFALAAGSCRKRLVLTYPRLEAGTARERVASSFLLAVAEALGGVRADYGTLANFDRLERVPLSRLHPAAPEDAESELEYDLATAALPEPREVLSLARLSPFFARGIALDLERWSPRLGRYDGVLGQGSGPLDRALSATRLETYATCPIQYFFHYELGLVRLDDPERLSEVEPLERGRIIHAILRAFLAGVRASGRALAAAPREALGDELETVATAEFARREQTAAVGPAFLWDLQKSAIRTDLERWLDVEIDDQRSGAWMPAMFEVRFGPRDGGSDDAAGGEEDAASRDEPAVFDLGGGRSVAFRGRIDRIDLSFDRRRFRVIDYKTGGVYGAKGETVRGGRALQLPVYLLAGRQLAAAAAAGQKSAIGEAQYFFVTRRGGFARVAYSDKGAAAKREALAGAVRLITDGIAAGRFEPEPEADTCRRCDYLRICGSSRARVAELKAGDPARRPFEQLRAIE